jgi:hypothetical protein
MCILFFFELYCIPHASDSYCKSCDEKNYDTLAQREINKQRRDSISETRARMLYRTDSIVEIKYGGKSENECAASNQISGKCYVTFEELQNGILAVSRNNGIQSNQDSVESVVLRFLLARSARPDFIKKLAESLGTRILNSADSLYWAEIQNALNGVDKRKLKDIYSEYYAQFFSRKVEKNCLVIQSSDSMHINNLYEMLMKSKNHGNYVKVSIDRINYKVVIPWKTVKCSDLESTAKRLVDSIPLGKISKPIQVSIGKMIILPTSINVIPEIKFENAAPLLLYLLNHEKAVQKKTTLVGMPTLNKTIQAASNSVKVWIMPQYRVSKIADSIVEASASAHLSDQFGSLDTANYRGTQISDHKIPQPLRSIIVSKNGYADILVGPINLAPEIYYYKWKYNYKPDIEFRNERSAERAFGKESLTDQNARRMKYAQEKSDDFRANIYSKIIETTLKSNDSGRDPGGEAQDTRSLFSDWISKSVNIFPEQPD